MVYMCHRVELGWVIRVIFCPDQSGLTCFIKYLGLTKSLHWITCVDNGVWC